MNLSAVLGDHLETLCGTLNPACLLMRDSIRILCYFLFRIIDKFDYRLKIMLENVCKYQRVNLCQLILKNA